MSGLAGVCYFAGRSVEASALDAMMRALAHRGPDRKGVWRDGPVGFAHLMLWTTPESLAETLPFFDSTSELAITADARVDNRDELLLDLGIAAAVSDSALILAAYRKWGEDCPEKLVGDFAFAIYDRKERRLFAARDRIGVKPFYYHHQEGAGFFFASEISPIFAASGLGKRPDRDAIEGFLDSSDLPHECTLFEGVKRLPPGSKMALQLDGRLAISRYWEPSFGDLVRRRDLTAHAEEFYELLTRAVKAQMRSAYPVGCLLSGGLDSSSVLCLASRSSEKKSALHAFSMVFDHLPCDEREYIAQVVRSTNVQWTGNVVDSGMPDGWKILEDCYSRQPEWPVQDLPASLTMWPLTNAARQQGIRVVLTGSGGDQVAQGSPWYLADLLASFRFVALARELHHFRFSRSVISSWTLAPLLSDRQYRIWLRFRRLFRPTEESWRLTRRSAREWSNPYRLPKHAYKRAAAWHEACWVADPILSLFLDGWWDPLGAHSQIEFRHPFFDVRLIQFFQTLPAEEKFWGGLGKIVMREGMKGVLPEMVRLRTSKAEFSPIVSLVTQGLTIDFSTLALAKSGLVESAHIESLAGRANAATSATWFTSLWRLVRTDAWYKLHFDHQLTEMKHVY